MEKELDEIVDNLFAVLPVIHKKLLNFLDSGISQDISHYHFAILGMLSKADALPVSEIGRRLLISKSQMTAMIDKMADLDLVSRIPDQEDRRIIHIMLTARGKETLSQAKANIKKNVKTQLSQLEAGDIEILSEALKNIYQIGSKIQ